MKKVLFSLLAVCCLAFVSCYKESEYTITYVDNFTSMANITAFEYDGTQLVAKRELKRVQPNTIYEMTSSDLADRVVIGVEAITDGKISEYYSANIFRLDHDKTTHITVSFTDMETSPENPINPEDRISRYLNK